MIIKLYEDSEREERNGIAFRYKTALVNAWDISGFSPSRGSGGRCESITVFLKEGGKRTYPAIENQVIKIHTDAGHLSAEYVSFKYPNGKCLWSLMGDAINL